GLKVVGADFRGRNVSGDRQDRHTRTVAVEQAVDQVQVTRSATAGADREVSGQVRLGAGSERGHLLVPDVDPLDRPLPPNGSVETIQAVADDAINALHASSHKGRRELVRNSGHANLLSQNGKALPLLSPRLPLVASRMALIDAI